MFNNFNECKNNRLGFMDCWCSILRDVFGLLVFESIISTIYLVAVFINSGPVETIEVPMSVGLFATIGGVAYVAFVVFFRYKWTRMEIGLTFTKQTVKEYWLGAALAFAMLAACIIPGVVLGAVHLSVAAINIDVLMKWVLFGLGFVIQSFSEEFLCRGVVFKHLLRRYSIWAATILQALIFMAMHSGNPGMGLIPYANLFLIGFVFGQVVIITDNLLLASGLHWFWNFAQGCIFGIKVSGMDGMPTLLNCDMTGGYLLTGGDFGIEGALSTTIVTIIVIGVLLPKMLSVIKNKSLPLPQTDRNDGGTVV